MTRISSRMVSFVCSSCDSGHQLQWVSKAGSLTGHFVPIALEHMGDCQSPEAFELLSGTLPIRLEDDGRTVKAGQSYMLTYVQ